MWVAILDIVRTNVPNTLNCAATDLICHHYHRLSTPARCHFVCRMYVAILNDVCISFYCPLRRGDLWKPFATFIIINVLTRTGAACHLLVPAQLLHSIYFHVFMWAWSSSCL